MKKLALALLFCSCAPHKAPQPDPPNANPVSYAEVVARLNGQLPGQEGRGFLNNGWVVTRSGTGGADDTGNSLLWTGLALYGLPCVDQIEAQALQSMLAAGVLVDYPGSSPADFDDVLGLYRGVAARLTRCHDDPAPWRGLAALSGQVKLSAGFAYPRDLLLAKLGTTTPPPAGELAELEASASAWAAADIFAEKSCYRVHLALLALQTVEDLGGHISANGKQTFCNATKNVGLPTVDNWCGRAPISDWLPTFTYDRWNFRHQRCSAWETPDGKGNFQPGVDFLVGYADGGGLN